MARLYTTPTDYIELPKDRGTSLLGEIASLERSGEDIFTGLLGWLPNPDPVLRKLGKQQEVFEDLLSDPELYGAARQRRMGIQKLLWDLDGTKSDVKTTRFMEDLYDDLDIYRIIGEALEGLLRGYAPMETMWKRLGNKYDVPVDVVGKPSTWFRYGIDRQLRFLSRDNPIMGEQVPPMKFLVARQNPTYKNQYGDADLSRTYWSIFFKRTDTKSLLRFVEKHAQPWILASYPHGTKQDEIDEVRDALDDMVQDAVGIFPELAKVEIHQAGTKATSEIYDSLYYRCVTQINKVMLGHGAASDSTAGKLGAEDMAIEIRDDIIDAAKRMVESTMNQLTTWIVKHNLGDRPIPKFRMYKEEDVDKVLAERDAILAKDLGVGFTPEYIEATYKIDRKHFEMKEPSVPTPPAPTPQLTEEKPAEEEQSSGEEFAESDVTPDQQSIDALLSLLTPQQLSAQVDEMVETVVNALQECEDYSEALQKVKTIYPKMRSTDLESVLRQSLLLSSIIGRVSASGD